MGYNNAAITPADTDSKSSVYVMVSLGFETCTLDLRVVNFLIPFAFL